MVANDVGISPLVALIVLPGLGLSCSRFYSHRGFWQSVRTRITSRPGILTPPQHPPLQPDHLPPLSVQSSANCQNLAIYVQDGTHTTPLYSQWPFSNSPVLPPPLSALQRCGPYCFINPSLHPVSAVSKWRLELLWKMVLC